MVRLNSALSRVSHLLSFGYAHLGRKRMPLLQLCSLKHCSDLLTAAYGARSATLTHPDPVPTFTPLAARGDTAQVRNHAPRRENLSRP